MNTAKHGNDRTDRRRKPYHHGDLRNAILDAVAAQVSAVGPDGVSLRAAAKTAGVSSAAAFRHFADKRAVMTAIAVEGFRGMIERIHAAIEAAPDDPAARFHAVGASYVTYALDEPERFRVMFRADLIDEDDRDLSAACAELQDALYDGLKPLAGADAASFERKALLAWAGVHGLATLAIEGALDDAIPPQARRDVLTGAVWGMMPIFVAPDDGAKS